MGCLDRLRLLISVRRRHTLEHQEVPDSLTYGPTAGPMLVSTMNYTLIHIRGMAFWLRMGTISDCRGPRVWKLSRWLSWPVEICLEARGTTLLRRYILSVGRDDIY